MTVVLPIVSRGDELFIIRDPGSWLTVSVNSVFLCIYVKALSLHDDTFLAHLITFNIKVCLCDVPYDTCFVLSNH